MSAPLFARVPAANDNALATHLASDQGQRATLATTLTLLRLAKCSATLTAAQLSRIQAAIESA